MNIIGINSINIRTNSFQLRSTNNYPRIENRNISFGANFDQYFKQQADFFNHIRGFEKEKADFFGLYILPLINTNSNYTVPSVTLCSPDETILNMFSSEIKNFGLKNGLNIVEMSPDNDSEDLLKRIHNQLEYNRKYYLNSKKRSVIIIDRPEKFIGIDSTELENYDRIKISKKDKNFLKQQNNIIGVNRFKSILDMCNSLPESDKAGFATTFVFKTQKPHLMHPHIRDGKTEKYYIDFASADNLKQIIYSYINENQNQNRKVLKKQDNIYISELLSLFFAKNENQGTYKIKTITDLIDKSLKDPKTTNPLTFGFNLINNFRNTPRDFSVWQMEYYQKIKNSISQTLDEYEKLKAYEQDGMLDEQEEKRLSQIIAHEKLMLKNLLYKKQISNLDLSERRILKKLLERYH